MKLRTILVVLPACVIGASFAIANRSFVKVSFDPTGLAPFLTTPEIPLFLVVLGAMFLGILIGGTGAWLSGKKKQRTKGVVTPPTVRPTSPETNTEPKSNLPAVAKPQSQRAPSQPVLPG